MSQPNSVYPPTGYVNHVELELVPAVEPVPTPEVFPVEEDHHD